MTTEQPRDDEQKPNDESQQPKQQPKQDQPEDLGWMPGNFIPGT
jgi:hypothetical protein